MRLRSRQKLPNSSTRRSRLAWLWVKWNSNPGTRKPGARTWKPWRKMRLARASRGAHYETTTIGQAIRPNSSSYSFVSVSLLGATLWPIRRAKRKDHSGRNWPRPRPCVGTAQRLDRRAERRTGGHSRQPPRAGRPGQGQSVRESKVLFRLRADARRNEAGRGYRDDGKRSAPGNSAGVREAPYSLLDRKADGYDCGGRTRDATAGKPSGHQSDGELLERVGRADARTVSPREGQSGGTDSKNHRAVWPPRPERNRRIQILRRLALRPSEERWRGDYGFRVLWRGMGSMAQGPAGACFGRRTETKSRTTQSGG